jgi:hypothetical protein
MAVVAPLGLRLLRTPGVARLVPIWPAAALGAAWGLLQERGDLAVSLCLPYVTGCVAVAALSAWRLLRGPLRERRLPTTEMAAAFAGLSLLVAATSLVAERAGEEAFGFPLAIHGLAVAHFHFASFAAVLVAALTARESGSRVATAGAWAVPIGTAVTFAGFFTGEYVELAGASILTAGLLATSHVLFRLRPNAFLLVASLALPLTMALAMWWAAGEAVGFAHPTIETMARTHGVANALGVGLCGLLGWRRAAPL